MDTVRKLTDREVHIIAGSIYEYFDGLFPEKKRSSKNKAALRITKDIISNFDLNRGLDGIRDRANDLALPAGIKFSEAWNKLLQG